MRLRGRILSACRADRDPPAVRLFRIAVRSQLAFNGDAVFADDPDRILIHDLDVCRTFKPLNVHDLLKRHAIFRSEPNERIGTDFDPVREQFRFPAGVDLSLHDDASVRGKRYISLKDLRNRVHVRDEADFGSLRVVNGFKQTVDE